MSTYTAPNMHHQRTTLEKNDNVIPARPEDYILRNRGLVYRVVKQFRPKAIDEGIDLDEIVQSGMLGLTRAANTYRTDRGALFSTYATTCIRNEIIRVFNENGIIRIKARSRNEKKMLKAYRELTQEHGRTPYVTEIADRCEISPERFKVFARAWARRGAAQCTRNDEELKYSIASKSEEPVYKNPAGLAEKLLSKSKLSPRQDAVVRMLYGIGCDAMSGDEIAEKLSITKGGVSYIKLSALKKMREHAEKNPAYQE